MMEYFKRLASSEFTRNVSVMLSGIVVGQLISVVSLIVLSRLYSVSDIGLLTLFLNTQGFLGIFATLTYDNAIMLPKEESEAIDIVRLCMQWAMVMGVIAVLPVSFCYFFEIFVEKGTWLFAIPLSIIVFGFLLATWAYHHRHKNFKLVATNKILQSTAVAAFQIAFFRFGANGLVWGFVLGMLVSLLSLWLRNRMFLQEVLGISNWDFSFTRAVAVRFNQFPLYSAPNAMLNQLSGIIPDLMMTAFYGLEIVALFAVGKRLVHMPVNVIVVAISRVFYQKSLALYHENPMALWQFSRKVYRSNLFVGIIPAVILFFIAPYLFEVLFGTHWRHAGVYTQYLLPWIFMVLLNGPIESVINVFDKQKEQLWLQLLLAALRVFSIFAGYYFWNSADMSILLLGGVGLVYQCFISWYLFKIIKEKALA